MLISEEPASPGVMPSSPISRSRSRARRNATLELTAANASIETGTTKGSTSSIPASFGPHCSRVTLTVYSEKEPDTGDNRVVDPKVLERITRDFAPL